LGKVLLLVGVAYVVSKFVLPPVFKLVARQPELVLVGALAWCFAMAGFASYLDVLQAEQNLFPAENALAVIRFQRLANFVQLYKALGGGWNIENPTWVREGGNP